MKSNSVAGHVPKEKSRPVYYFLSRDGHTGFCETRGMPTNRGIDLGVEVPCVYRFYGHVTTLKDLSSYFSESFVVGLGSVDLYAKYYLCIYVRARS